LLLERFNLAVVSPTEHVSVEVTVVG